MIEVDGFEPKTNFSCPNHREELGHSRLQFFASFPAQKSDKSNALPGNGLFTLPNQTY